MKKKPLNHAYISALTAGLICLLVFLRALSCDFVNWDDTDYVLNNELIRTLDWNFLATVFTSIPYDFYIPLTTLSLAIDYRLWGLNPLGYHLTNILFHAINCGLLVLLADRLLNICCKGEGGEVSFASGSSRYLYPATLLLSGLLWGIHPARVESVVWVTERKDVLNGFFVLLALLCYIACCLKREAGSSWYKEYAGAFFFFCCSLMSKPTSIVLPGMLLLLDAYPLRRFQPGRIPGLLLEKIPFVLCAVAAVPATITRFAEIETSFHSMEFFPLWARVVVSGNALFEYFRLSILPVGILPYYDLPLAIPRIFVLKAAAVFLLLIVAFYWGRRRLWAQVTLAAFILPLIPVLPFLGNGASIAFAMRYTYLPALFPSILMAVLAAAAVQRAKESGRQNLCRLLTAGVLLLLIAYGGLTWQLIGVWKDSGTMWSRVIASQPFDRAYFYRGLFYAETGNFTAAVNDYTECLGIISEKSKPEIYNLYAFRAEALIQAGRFAEAVTDLDAAIAMFPHKLYYYHRGLALQGLGRFREAELDFGRAGRARGKMHWFPVGAADA